MSDNLQKHRWSFFKAGGVYQVKIESGSDIENIGSLDKKLWAALSCPTSGLFFDQKTLDFVDANKDGRIMRDELVQACEWVSPLLKNTDRLLDGSSVMKLSEINDATDEGKALLDSAKQALSNLGKSSADEISVDDFADTTKIFANVPFNGDGIITEEAAAGDAPVAAVIADIVKAYGGKTDRSGKQGADAELVEKFYAALSDYAAWGDSPKQNKDIMFLGDNTADAYAAYAAVKDKIDDYFTRAQIIAFDPTVKDSVNPSAETFGAILAKDVSDASADLKALPAARIGSVSTLKVDGDVNPAWRDALAAFHKKTMEPLLGPGGDLNLEGWNKIKAAVAPYEAWTGAKPSDGIAQIDLARSAEILKGDEKGRLLELIAKDESMRPKAENILKVEQLVRYHKNLYELVANFASFQSFYREGENAIFQYGNLYIDKRMCGLCIKVNDPAKHAQMSPLSYGYLLYCTCKRAGEPDLNIAALVSSGDSDSLIVGRNGVFYDRLGRDWDATVTKIVENPIGISQAFWSPYKRIVKVISEQFAKYTTNADSDVVNKLQTGISAAATPPAAGAAPKKIDVGTVAALGVAFAGITAAFAAIMSFFKGMGPWLPLGILGIILAISLPSMIMAAMKLRIRNLAPLLDANGWAINGRSNVNIVFGSHLTQVGHLPLNAKRDRQDPYVHKRTGLKLGTAVVVAVAVAVGALWYFNKLSFIGLEAPSWSYVMKDKAKEEKAKNAAEAKGEAAPPPEAAAPAK